VDAKSLLKKMCVGSDWPHMLVRAGVLCALVSRCIVTGPPTFEVRGASSQQARSVDAKELEVDLMKVDGAWVIQAIRPVEAMKLD
jgi:hypothetical protein